MTIDELRNSDFVRMKKREEKRCILYASIVAVLTICAVLYILNPISFDDNLFTNNNVAIAYSEPVVATVYDNGEPISKSDIKTKQFNFNRESTEFQQIKELFDKYSYHICFKTLINADTIEQLTHNITMQFGDQTIIITDVPYMIVGGNVYRIGYIGISKISELNVELKDILNIK
jgi:hypothetical protein